MSNNQFRTSFGKRIKMKTIRTVLRAGAALVWTAGILLAPQIIQAQGTIYLSNLGQPSASSMAVGSDSWLAAGFETGTNAGGYLIESIQLGMEDALGNPSGFTVMLYKSVAGGPARPGNVAATLDGSLNPVTAGIYTYSAPSNFTLLPNFQYFIVLTAGTVIANGAYEWSLASENSYNPSDGWNTQGGNWTSSNGSISSWNSTSGFPQFAINATPIPEPGVLGLFGLGGLCFLWHRRKTKAV
jgi:hypothetical protein